MRRAASSATIISACGFQRIVLPVRMAMSDSRLIVSLRTAESMSLTGAILVRIPSTKF
jgi:hypothetical protein